MDTGTTHIFLYTIAVLFPVANPVGLSIPFHVMTQRMEVRERKMLAWRVALYFFLLVVGALLFGTLVLRVFSLSVGIVDLAGGLVLFHTAWNLMADIDRKQDYDEEKSGQEIGFFPLTMPLTADAAVLAVTLSLSNSIHSHWDYTVMFEFGAGIAGIAIVALSVGIFYNYSHHTARWLGGTGIKVATSIIAFLMMGVAIEIFVTGLRDVAATF